MTKALTCGQLLTSLVDDLLDRTRITTGKFCAVLGRVSVVALVDDVVELASHLNRNRYRPRIKPGPCSVALLPLCCCRRSDA